MLENRLFMRSRSRDSNPGPAAYKAARAHGKTRETPGKRASWWGNATLVVPAVSCAVVALSVAHPAAAAKQPRVPLVLKKHVKAGDRLGYPHAATSSELGEAVTWVMRFTTRSLGRGVGVTCWTNQYGDAGWYACRIRNGNGRVRGVPRVYRSATLRVDWHGRPEITYRGRVPGGTASVRYAAGKNVSGAVYNCCHAEVGR